MGVTGAGVIYRARVRCVGHARCPSSSMAVTVKDAERQKLAEKFDQKIMVTDYLDRLSVL